MYSKLMANDQDAIISLIRLIKQYPTLHTLAYRKAQNTAWLELQEITGVSMSLLISKWKSLRELYSAELVKELQSAKRTFCSEWPFFQEMKFIRTAEMRRIRSKMQTSSGKKVAKDRQAAPRKVGAPRANFKPTSSVTIKCEDEDDVKPVLAQMTEITSTPKSGSSNATVYWNPIPDPSSGTIDMGMDADYDFLLTRIYPYLSGIPIANKHAVYTALQNAMYKEFLRVRNVLQSLEFARNGIV